MLHFTNALAADIPLPSIEHITGGEKHHRHQTDDCRTMPQEKSWRGMQPRR